MMESELKAEISRLKAENDRLRNIVIECIKSPTAQHETVLQKEVGRLTLENLDLSEKTNKLQVQVGHLEGQIKDVQKKLETGGKFEASHQQNGQDSVQPVELVPVVKKEAGDYLGMLKFQTGDEGKICRVLIPELEPRVAVNSLAGLPAYIIFMCIRYLDHLDDDKRVRTLLSEAITMVKELMRKKRESDMEVAVLWLSNVLRLLHTLKQYSGDAMFQHENTPKQNEQSLMNFDLSEYYQVLSDIAVWIYTSVIRLLEDKIQPLIVPAILENDSGVTFQVTVSGSMSAYSEDGGAFTKPLETLWQQLDYSLNLLQCHSLDPEVIEQVFRQLFYYISAGAFNNLLTRRDLCHWSTGIQIRHNVSILEEWCRENKMNLEVVGSLQPIIQASQLLQAQKKEKDVNALCDMCDKLTINQVVKLLNLYTPSDESEERLPMSTIRLVLKRLLEIRRSTELNPQHGTGSNLLMDTKYSFPVKFPFNASNIRLEEIEIPEAFNISKLVARI